MPPFDAGNLIVGLIIMAVMIGITIGVLVVFGIILGLIVGIPMKLILHEPPLDWLRPPRPGRSRAGKPTPAREE